MELLTTTRITLEDGATVLAGSLGAGAYVLGAEGKGQEAAIEESRRTRVKNTISLRVAGSMEAVRLLDDQAVYAIRAKDNLCRMVEAKLASRNRFGEQRAWCTFGVGPFCAEQKCCTNVVSPVPIQASSLRVGDWVFSPVYANATNTALTPEMGRILGWYAAEGHLTDGQVSRHTGKRVCRRYMVLSWGWTEEHTYVKQSIALLTKLGYPVTNCRTGSEWIVRARSDDLAAFCEFHVGRHADKKRLSLALMGAPRGVQMEFIVGYLQGDGSVVEGKVEAKRRVLSWVSTSRALTEQVNAMIERCGCSALLLKVKGKVFDPKLEPRGRNNAERYDGVISKREANVFLPAMGEGLFPLQRQRRGTHYNVGLGCLSQVKKMATVKESVEVLQLSSKGKGVVLDRVVAAC